MRVVIHQPHYFPWIRYYVKMAKADYFVIYDDVAFQKNGCINRTKIRDRRDFLLTIPVHGSCHKKINNIETVDELWKEKHIKSIKIAYQSSKYFNDYFDIISDTIRASGNNLSDINISTIRMVNSILEMDVKLVKSSELNTVSKKTSRLVDICKKLNCDTYISGYYAIEQYLEQSKFTKEGIKVVWPSFECKPYAQSKYKDFIPDLSILDLIMNHPVSFCKEYILNSTLNELC